MKNHSQHFFLESQLAPDQVWQFLLDPTFWTQAWRATTTTASADTALSLQTHFKFALAKVKVSIVKTEQLPPHELLFTVQVKSQQLLFRYQVEASPTGSTLHLTVDQPDTDLIASWQMPFIHQLTKHHWQELSSTFHTFQHDQLFAQLQPEGSLLAASTVSATDDQEINQAPVSISSDSVPVETQTTSPLIFFFPSQLSQMPLPTLGFSIWRIATDWQRITKKTFNEEKLTSTQWLLLYSLVELATQHPSLTGSQLAAATGLHKMVISDITTQLVNKHYLRKIKLPHNKKEYQLQATAAGKSAAFAAFAKLQQAEKQFFDALPATTKAQLSELCSESG